MYPSTKRFSQGEKRDEYVDITDIPYKVGQGEVITPTRTKQISAQSTTAIIPKHQPTKIFKGNKNNDKVEHVTTQDEKENFVNHSDTIVELEAPLLSTSAEKRN